MKLEEVKQFLEDNKESEEVKAYLQDLHPLSVEGVQEFLETDKEAKSWFDSTVDKRTSKSLETWKANHLEQLINDEIKQRFPEKDEKDIELEKLKAEVDKMQQEKHREGLVNKAIKYANEKSLPVNLVDFFIGENEEATINNLQALEETFQTSVQKVVEQRLKGDGYNPPQHNESKQWTIDAVKGLSQKEVNENWDDIKHLLKNN